jgi:hypothetical protein
MTLALNLEIAAGERTPPRPGVVAGSVEQVTDTLGHLVGLGFSVFNFIPVALNELDQAETLANEVVPAVRAMA